MQILQLLPISLFLYLSLLSKYRADSDEPPCFVVNSSRCAELSPGSKCKLTQDKANNAQIFCCNVTNERQLYHFLKNNVSSSDHILGFHMRDSSLEKLEIPIFDGLRRLATFSITDSNITRINGGFDGHSSLTCLNISYNMILEMNPFVILKLKGLKNIVISNNTNMSMLPEFSNELKGLKLDVSGNLQLSCKYLINLTLAVAEEKMSFSLNNRNLTMCSPPSNNNYKHSYRPYRASYVNMDHIDQVKEIVADCPEINSTNKCECSVYSLDVDEDPKVLIYTALVNCSRRSLTSLPNKLPSATRILDISHNNITSIEGIGDRRFNNIQELFADYNKIASLKPLEGTIFANQFNNLSLRNNKIEQIQVYMLSNVFDRLQGTRIMLAENELKCDCHTSSQVKLFLIANKDHVPDFNEIYAVCGNTKIRVIELNQKDHCTKNTEWKDYIRFVIYGEIFIFVFLIGKVSYDYYIFKTFGYLPWPASKMPKLPCDWCFEN